MADLAGGGVGIGGGVKDDGLGRRVIGEGGGALKKRKVIVSKLLLHEISVGGYFYQMIYIHLFMAVFLCGIL